MVMALQLQPGVYTGFWTERRGGRETAITRMSRGYAQTDDSWQNMDKTQVL